jgi:ATP-binding cassette subfamily F protein 3
MLPTKIRKRKALQNKLKVESQIKQLEKTFSKTIKCWPLIMTTSKTLSFTAYNKTELDKLLLDWEVVQEEIDNL